MARQNHLGHRSWSGPKHPRHPQHHWPVSSGGPGRIQ
ncbi:hypothetical protein LINPERPRIM_LOCUS9373 [Linum perenne]